MITLTDKGAEKVREFLAGQAAVADSAAAAGHRQPELACERCMGSFPVAVKGRCGPRGLDARGPPGCPLVAQPYFTTRIRRIIPS